MIQANSRTWPDEAYSGAVAIVGTTGAGKSFTAKGAIEPELDRGARVCVIDPTGAWWGLRASADGQQPGFPVLVLGGDHGDLPLDDRAGDRVGRLISEKALQVVLDVSEMSMAGRVRFVTALLEALYQHNRQPLYLILDEADLFAPQRPMPDQTVLLNRVENIARRGRIRGFKVWMLTQRPAELHKSVLSQAGTLVAMKLTAPQDRDAIGAWIDGQADRAVGKQVLADLPKLATGEGFLWCPAAGLLERRAFPRISTFDSSRTPEEGEDLAGPTTLAAVDLAELTSLISAEEANEAKPPSAAALRAAEERGYALGLDDGERNGRAAGIALAQAALAGLGASPPPTPTPTPPAVAPTVSPSTPAKAPRPTSDAKPQTAGALGLLNAAARVHPVRLTWAQVATLAGRKPSGGHFNSSRKAALDQGWLLDAGGLIGVTAAGLAVAGVPEAQGDPADIFAAALLQPARKMFEVIREKPGITVIGLATVLEMQPRGGHWNNGMATLKRNGLIRAEGDQLHPADFGSLATAVAP